MLQLLGADGGRCVVVEVKGRFQRNQRHIRVSEPEHRVGAHYLSKTKVRTDAIEKRSHFVGKRKGVARKLVNVQ